MLKTSTIMSILGIILGIVIGWYINGWRLEANIEALKASYAKERVEYLQEVRNREKSLLEASERMRKDRDAKVKDLNTRLQSVTGELQLRQKREDSRNTTNTAACSGATGAELSREDAEFLARESARADAIVRDLNYCIGLYNKLRSN